jgi:hypothetical protein
VYEFSYNFNISAVAPVNNPINSLTASMEVWLSSSTGATLLDQNKIVAPFNDVFYRGVLGQVPNGYSNIIIETQSVTITVPTGYDIYEYNLPTDTTPFNILPINTNTTYRLYRITGVPFSGPGSETFRVPSCFPVTLVPIHFTILFSVLIAFAVPLTSPTFASDPTSALGASGAFSQFAKKLIKMVINRNDVIFLIFFSSIRPKSMIGFFRKLVLSYNIKLFQVV